MNRTQEEIKAEIEIVLQSNPIDYSRFTALSNELIKLDRDHIRFSVDAGIINRLGKELVGRSETAISELVKNAYDADASYARLVFRDAYNPGGTLIIEDDGNGMGREALVDGFMRISSSDKIHQPVSPNYLRRRAGKKGIGRFAAQRLGGRLIIVSQTADSDQAIKATINWADYVMDVDINEIVGRIEYVPKERDHGTTLYVEALSDGWSDATIRRAYRYTEDLLIPEPLSRERQEWESGRVDPGFKASFYRDVVSEETKVVDENIAFFNQSLAVIEGYIDENRQGYWRYWSDKLNVSKGDYKKIGKDRDNVETPFMFARSIHFKTYYFIYERSLIPGTLFSYVKNLGSEIGGIRLYRNGFRVPPYGEKQNDWLGLDASTAKRTYLFPHQNQCYFGYVEIDSASSDLFEETSSREGLIENDAFKDIKDFVYRVVITAGLEIAAIRQRKQTANQKDWEKTSTENDLIGIIEELSSLVDETFSARDYSKDSWTREDAQREEQRHKERYYETLNRLREQEARNRRLLNEISMLRVLAGLGLAIGEFTHEIKHFFPGFKTEVDYLKELMRNNDDAMERLNLLYSNFVSMESFLTFFDDSVSENVRRDLVPIDIKVELSKFERVIEEDARKASIDVDDNRKIAPAILSDMVTTPMHPSEWASIFFNLYSNSKKAIKRSSNKNRGRIYIECLEGKEMISVDFSDNGSGVDAAVKDHIFDAFVTTTSAASQDVGDEDAYTGTGLGLSILKDIVESYKGRIFLCDTPKTGYNTTFRIEIPKLK